MSISEEKLLYNSSTSRSAILTLQYVCAIVPATLRIASCAGYGYSVFGYYTDRVSRVTRRMP
jgi:hypothetical protein